MGFQVSGSEGVARTSALRPKAFGLPYDSRRQGDGLFLSSAACFFVGGEVQSGSFAGFAAALHTAATLSVSRRTIPYRNHWRYGPSADGLNRRYITAKRYSSIALETEDHLKINAAVRCLGRGAAAEDAAQRVRVVE